MDSPDKVSRDHILSTRTRSAAKTAEMVAPHPDEDGEETEDESEKDQLPNLLESDAADLSDFEDPGPSTSAVTPSPAPRRKKTVSSERPKRRGRKSKVVEDPGSEADVPDLVGGRDSSLEQLQNKGGKARSVTIVTPTRPAPILRRKKKQTKPREAPRVVENFDCSTEDSTYETAADSEPAPYHARRRNIRRKLSKKHQPRTEPMNSVVRRRHRAGGDSVPDPYSMSEDPLPKEPWCEVDSDGGYSEEDELRQQRFNLQPVQVMKEVEAPKFDGTNFKAFKVQFLTVCQLNGWTPQERAARLRCSLIGDAMQILAAADVNEWTDVRWLEEMDLRHGQIKAVCDVSNLILDMEKGSNQSSLAYADSLESIAQKSEMAKSQRDAICYTAFIHGIRKNRKMQRYVLRRDRGKTVGSAARCASVYEREMGDGDVEYSGPVGTVNVDARTTIEKQSNSKVTISTDDKAGGGASGEAFVSLNPATTQVASAITVPENGDRLDGFLIQIQEKINAGNAPMQKQIDSIVGRLDEGDRARAAAKERRQANWNRNNGNPNYNNNNNNNYQGDNRQNGGGGNGGRRNYNNNKKKNKQDGANSEANDGAASSNQVAQSSTSTQA